MKAPMNTLLYLRGLGGDQAHFTIEVDKYRAHPLEKKSLKGYDIRLEGNPADFTFKVLGVNLCGNSKAKDEILMYLSTGMTAAQIIKMGKYSKAYVYQVAADYKVVRNNDDDE